MFQSEKPDNLFLSKIFKQRWNLRVSNHSHMWGIRNVPKVDRLQGGYGIAIGRIGPWQIMSTAHAHVYTCISTMSMSFKGQEAFSWACRIWAIHGFSSKIKSKKNIKRFYMYVWRKTLVYVSNWNSICMTLLLFNSDEQFFDVFQNGNILTVSLPL